MGPSMGKTLVLPVPGVSYATTSVGPGIKCHGSVRVPVVSSWAK